MRPLYQRLLHQGFNGDGHLAERPYKGLLVTLRYKGLLVSLLCNKTSAGDGRKRPLAVGRIIAPSRRSKAPNDWGTQRRIKGGRPPLAGGRTGAVDSSSPTHKGSINQVTSSVRGSFGALSLRSTAMIRRTSCEVLLCASVYYAAGITAFDGWICRVDVIRVGADLRVRPFSSKR